MRSRIATYELTGNPALAEAVRDSHAWVLSAMSQHGESLVNLLWRILGSEEDACDAYQDTFLKLAHFGQNQGQAQPRPENIKAYLFRTAANTAMSMLRRRKVRQEACRKLAEMRDPLATNNVAGELDAVELKESLRGYLSRLPDGLREVVMLHDLAEMPYHQVAGILGISSGSARVYRYRAIQLLARWMTEKKTG